MMRLSTKGRYATRIMVYLARHSIQAPVCKKDIAAAEDITPDYVEQILIKLKSTNLVRSHRGAKGGFSLGSDPKTITISQVLEATEGPSHLVPCLNEKCPREISCPARPLWKKAEQALIGVFATKTIADLLQDSQKAAQARSPTFDI